MSILAYIPARGGSQGIKNKNMALLKKKPLIYYTLKLAKNLKGKVYTFVSTDSLKIKKYCAKEGIKSDYIRPKKFSKNNSTMFSGINHALKWLYKKKNKKFESILLLQPTSPIRELSDLNLAIKIFNKKKIKSLVSTTKMIEHPYECVEYKKRNRWNFIVSNPNKVKEGRQLYKENFYYIDGSFYIAKTQFYLKNKSFFNKKYTKFFNQKRKWPVDINDKEDLLIAETFLKKKRKI